MISGLYSATCGLYNEQLREEVVANNLANLQVTGFKKQHMSFEQVMSQTVERNSAIEPNSGPVLDQVGGGSRVSGTYTDFSAGPVVQTGNPLDVALIGEGQFLVVKTPQGLAYTRNGSFTLDQDGYLATQEGYRVQGTSGDIQANGGNYRINEDGSVTAGGQATGQLQVVSVASPAALERQGDALFGLPAGAEKQATAVENPQLKVGYLERANANPVESMVELIEVMRSYESNYHVVQTLDHTLDQAVNEVGRYG